MVVGILDGWNWKTRYFPYVWNSNVFERYCDSRCSKQAAASLWRGIRLVDDENSVQLLCRSCSYPVETKMDGKLKKYYV